MRRVVVVLAAAAPLLVGAGCVQPPPPAAAPATTITSYTPPPIPNPLDDAARRRVVRIRTRTCDAVGVGSGFLVDPTTVVTNRHVVAAATSIDVETWDGRALAVASADEGRTIDLAVIHLQGPYEVTPFATGDPGPGDAVRAVGYPEGDEITATAGRILGFVDGDRYQAPGRVLQASTSIHPGNSGGPLLDDQDQVVGVVYAIDVDSSAALAIPLSQLRQTLDSPGSMRPVRACEEIADQ